jgi:signal transduction histidine kinase
VRRHVIVTSLAVTSMIVLALIVTLGLLVRDLARDRAIADAERSAESTARFLAVVGPSQGIQGALNALGVTESSEHDVTVVLSNGTVIGAPLQEGELVDQALNGTAVRVRLPGGEALHVPVVQSDGSIVVLRTFVSTEALTEGVAASWLTLGVLGLVLIGIAIVVSDRLARGIVTPISELSATAVELGRSNFDARVVPSGPKEIHAVGVEFNNLAERVVALLQQERETAADLSHQLRTPLMAVRLDAEALPEDPKKQRLIEDIDALARNVDFVIREARREVRWLPGTGCDLSAILKERVAFWSALAEEQDRVVDAAIEEGQALIGIVEDDARAMVDALIGNIFAHTDEGTDFAVLFDVKGKAMTLTVEDAGNGFSDTSVLKRGESGGTGTGLGLDIARRTAEAAGGSLAISRSRRFGGASVRIVAPVSPS